MPTKPPVPDGDPITPAVELGEECRSATPVAPDAKTFVVTEANAAASGPEPTANTPDGDPTFPALRDIGSADPPKVPDEQQAASPAGHGSEREPPPMASAADGESAGPATEAHEEAGAEPSAAPDAHHTSSETNGAEPSPTKWEKRRAQFDALDAWMKLIRSVVTNVLLLGLLCVVVVLAVVVAIHEADRSTIEMAPLSVPDELVKTGYTPEVFRRLLVDEYNKIKTRTNTVRKKDTRKLAPEWLVPEIQVPGAGLTLRSLVHFLAPRQKQVEGEVTIESDGKIRLRLRYRGEPLAEVGPVERHAIDQVLSDGAEALLARVDPYDLAVFHHSKHNDEKALVNIHRCLDKNQQLDDHDSESDDPWAYNLWGLILINDKQYPEAIEKFEAALHVKKDFAPAHAGWARALEMQDDNQGARKQMEEAINVAAKDNHPLMAQLLYNRGYFSLKIHNPPEAIALGARAVAPLPYPHPRWGVHPRRQ